MKKTRIFYLAFIVICVVVVIASLGSPSVYESKKALNAKYEQLSLQFASYGSLINQMESSFSGLKMLIQQSTSGN